MVTVYRVTSDPASPSTRVSESDEDSPWDLVDEDVSRRARPLRLTVTAVIGLALVGLSLTAAATIVRSLGTTDSVDAEVPQPAHPSEHSVELTIDDPTPREVIVHVVGEVIAPGIVSVVDGARVVDAIEAAGGVTGDAELASLNLARVVLDGEQIRVPGHGEEVGGVEPGLTSSQPGPISLSRADLSQLDSLPGIGPALAVRIIAWRETHGPFGQVSDVLAVAGVGPSTLEKFAHLVIP